MNSQYNEPKQTRQIILSLIIIVFVTTLSYMISPSAGILWGIIGAIFTFICADMARSRGRQIGAGMLGGYFFGILCVVYYLIAGETIEEKVKREEMARDRYRSSS
jgi:amino acid permease